MTLSIISSSVFLVLSCLFAAKAGDKLFDRSKLPFGAFAWLLAAAALIFRLFLAYNTVGYETDIYLFKTWGEMVNDLGYSRVYHSDVFLDYPPGFLYVLGFLDSLRELFGMDIGSDGYTLMIKLPSVLGDIAAGLIIYKLGEKLSSKATALFASAVYLFCPAIFINSAVWGQADGFCLLILLVSLLLLYGGKTIPSAVVYGLAVICKPQMLIFAPVYLFYTLYKKDIKGLVLGVLSGLVTIMLVATPYIENFDYFWLIEKYKSTMDYYAYYTVNAYNVWGMFGKNWTGLPGEGIGLFILNWFGPVLATALCGFFMWKGREKKHVIFPAAAVLMSTVYIFSVKMHERYLFPALIFIVITYFFTKDRKFLCVSAGLSFVHYLNVAYVLYLNNSWIDPMSLEIVALSAAHVALYFWFIYLVYVNYCANKKQPETKAQPKKNTAPKAKIKSNKGIEFASGGRMSYRDMLIALALTVFYAFFAFSGLGSRETANTSWTPKAGESVTFLAGEDISGISYLPGISANYESNTPVVGSSMTVFVSEDGVNWTTAAVTGDAYVYQWQDLYFEDIEGRYIRLVANNDSVVINEVAARARSQLYFAELIPVEGDHSHLIDEQDTVPVFDSHMNSSYFDEIYHARTAYEHILGVEPYENTHPTLGKLIIAVGISLFGMNPFGWRFMGALFGVLMLPVLYHLIKRLTDNSLISFTGTFIFAFDFMHYTQTRIATIDTYAVFFILLMYDAMVCFMQKDILKTETKKLLVPLALSGIFMGLGVASKWTVAYGALGLAVLYFIKLIAAYFAERKEREKLLKKEFTLCLWCLLFFVAIPFGIYFAAFLPVTTLPHNSYDVWGRFWSYQTHMFNYHSQLVAEHYFASPWYEWPLVIRNIWYFSSERANLAGDEATIVCLGNPITWWMGLAATVTTAIAFIKKKTLPGLVVLVGYAAVMVPWMLVERLTFVYHYFTAVPFIVIAIALVLKNFTYSNTFMDPCGEKGILAKLGGLQLVSLLLVVLSFVMFLVFFPAISGKPADYDYLKGLEWLSDWYFI